MSSAGREALTRWFEQMNYVFALPPGSAFPPIRSSVGEKDARLLRRYIEAARELAGSAVLSQPGVGYKAEFDQSGVTSVEASLPSAELVRGMSVLFRQFYANEEKASFEAVSGALWKHVEQHVDEETARRREMLTSWRTAQTKLRGRWLEGLLIKRGQELGLIPDQVGQPNKHVSPEQVLSAYFYGEHIHWGRGAAQVEHWLDNPFQDAHHRLLFLRAMSQLGSLYVGFGALVVTAAPFDDIMRDRHQSPGS